MFLVIHKVDPSPGDCENDLVFLQRWTRYSVWKTQLKSRVKNIKTKLNHTEKIYVNTTHKLMTQYLRSAMKLQILLLNITI